MGKLQMHSMTYSLNMIEITELSLDTHSTEYILK